MSGYVNNALTNLPFHNIIGGPLEAAIKAQAMAANTTVEFIKAVGFKPLKKKNADGKVELKDGNEVIDPDKDDPSIVGNNDSEIGDIRYVNFSYAKKNLDGSKAEGFMKVPILTIVPIPMLRIEEMTIDFNTKITESKEYDYERRSNNASYNYRGRGFWYGGALSVSMSRRSSKAKSSSDSDMESTLAVHVRAVGEAMPAGLSKMLGILEANLIDDHHDANTPKEIPMWEATQTYKANDVVHYEIEEGGEKVMNRYVCVNDGKNQIPSPSNPKWTLSSN